MVFSHNGFVNGVGVLPSLGLNAFNFTFFDVGHSCSVVHLIELIAQVAVDHAIGVGSLHLVDDSVFIDVDHIAAVSIIHVVGPITLSSRHALGDREVEFLLRSEVHPGPALQVRQATLVVVANFLLSQPAEQGAV